jgi:hypothetical protein
MFATTNCVNFPEAAKDEAQIRQVVSSMKALYGETPGGTYRRIQPPTSMRHGEAPAEGGAGV